MRTLLELALSNTLVALVPAVLAVVAGLCSRRPALVHALWLLVLVKMLTPPLVRVSLPWPAEPASLAVAGEVAAPEVVGLPEVEGEPLPEDVGWFVEQEPLAEPPAAVSEAVPTLPEWPAEWAEVLGGVWLFGSACWFALAARRAWLFSRALRYTIEVPADLTARVEELAGLVGLAPAPRTLLVPGRVTPMVWGTFRPVLLLPVGLCEQLDGDALDTLILHELAHVRRRDHWVRVLEFLALGLFWWNPLTWYAREQLRQAEEQCCDAWVVRVMPKAARTYAVALVDALDFLSASPPAAPPLACGIGEVADLKRRLKMILGKATPHALGPAGGFAVLALGALLLPLMAAVSRGDEEEQQQEARRPGKTARAEQLDDRDLERMQAELRAQMEAIERARQKLEAAKRALAEKKRQEEKNKAEAFDKDRLKVAPKEGGTTVHIQISGLKSKEDVEKLTEQLTKLLGKDVKVAVVRQEHKDGKFLYEFHRSGGMGGGMTWGSKQAQPTPAPKGMTVPAPPQPPKPPAPATDKRVEGLERKLDAVIRELEALRKEMKGGEPKEKGRGFGGGFGPKK